VRSQLGEGQAPLRWADEQVSSDDEAFPASNESDDDEEDEDTFHDALEGSRKSALRAMGQSRMARSRSGLQRSSLMHRSYASSAPVFHALRLHVGTAGVAFCVAGERLVLNIDDAVLSATARARQGTERAVEAHSKLSLSLGAVLISEESIGASVAQTRRILASFHAQRGDSRHLVYSSPHIHLDVALHSALTAATGEDGQTQGVKVHVALEPLVLSFSSRQVSKWVTSLSSLAPFGVNEQASSTPLQLSLELPVLQVYVHSDCDLSHSAWRQMHEALRLDVVSDGWQDIMLDTSNAEHLQQLVSGRSGGLLLECREIALSVQCGGEDVSAAAHSLEMEQARFSVFLPVPVPAASSSAAYRYFKYTLVKASSDAKGAHRLQIRRKGGRGEAAAAEGCRSSYEAAAWSVMEGNNCNGKQQAAEKEDIGPAAPLVDEECIVYVSCYLLEAGTIASIAYVMRPLSLLLTGSALTTLLEIQQREYSALMMIADVLVLGFSSLDPDAAGGEGGVNASSGNSNGGSFGMHISTRYATIALSENTKLLPRELMRSGRCDTVFEQLCAVLQQLREAAAVADADAELLKLCVSMRQPIFELYSVDKLLFVALKANDLSLFEMSPAQYDQLLARDFNFNVAGVPVVRTGLDRHRVPFIHRASTPALSYRGIQNGWGGSAASTMDVSLLGSHADFGYAFEVHLLLSQVPATASSASSPAGEASGPASRSVQLFIDFFDIMWNHDPASTWLLKLVSFLTPLTAEELFESHVEAATGQIQALKHLWEHDEHLVKRIQGICNELQSFSTLFAERQASAVSSEPRMPQAPPFEMTKILVRVRESVINYCDELDDSFTLLSVGLLTLCSTIVSSSPRFSLKIALKELSMQIAPLGDFRQRHFDIKASQTESSEACSARSLLVPVLDIDHVSTLVKIKDHDREDLFLQFAIGHCQLHGCVDSLQLFTVRGASAVTIAWRPTQYACMVCVGDLAALVC
jgi:hypothetical protein